MEACQQAGPVSQAPRMGAQEMASEQVDFVNERYRNTLENELIRAREIGQREGREDAQQQFQEERRLFNAVMQNLQDQLLNAKNAQPIYLYECRDSILLEVHNKAVSERDAAIRDLAERNADLTQRFNNQRETIGEMQETISGQDRSIAQLRQMNTNQWTENKAQEKTIADLQLRLDRKPSVGKFVRRVVTPTQSNEGNMMSLDVVDVFVENDGGLHITVA